MVDNIWAFDVDTTWIKAYVMTLVPNLNLEPFRPMFDEPDTTLGDRKVSVKWPASLILASKA
jgi:hypothetical protein